MERPLAAAELEEMRMESLAAVLPGEIVTILRQLPKDASPTAVMRSSISVLAHYDPESEDNSPAANRRKALAASWGRSAAVLAHFERIRNGHYPIEQRADLDPAWPVSCGC